MRFAVALAAAGLSLIALAAAISLGVGHETLAQPATTTVQVGDYYFCDQSYVNGVCETTVNAGDVVVWEWGPGGSGVGNSHTTTNCADSFTLCGGPREWDSGNPLQTSGTFPHTFGAEDAGQTFLYICQIHPLEMRGRIAVLAAAEPSPSPQASPQASAPAATPTPAAQPSAVPSGGGAPPTEGGAALWWIAAALGGMLIGSAALLAARRR